MPDLSTPDRARALTGLDADTLEWLAGLVEDQTGCANAGCDGADCEFGKSAKCREHEARLRDIAAALRGLDTAALSQGAADAAPEGLEPIAYLAAGSAKDLNEVRIERRIQRDGRVLWVVIEQFGDVLNHSGEWEYEPMPSSRDDDFLARTRYESAAAAAAAFKALATLPPAGAR